MVVFLNAGGISNTLEEGSNYFEESLKPALPAEFSWNYLTSPEGLARSTGDAAEAAPVVAGGAGALSLAARGGKLLSKITGISEKVGTWATRGTMSSIPEAGMEAGNFEKYAIANRMSPSEAAKKVGEFSDAMQVFSWDRMRFKMK